MTRMRSILLSAGTSLVLVLTACGSGPPAAAVNSSGGSVSGPATGAGNLPGSGGGDRGPGAGPSNPPAGASSGSVPAAPAGNSSGVRGPIGAGLVAVRSGKPATTVKETDYLTFAPASLTVKVGDIVDFTNGGSIPHNVTFQYAGIGSATMKGGSTFLVKFTSRGTYPFVCTLHFAGMTGTITVS